MATNKLLSSIIDISNYANTTGKWYIYPWWLNKRYIGRNGLTKDRIEAGFKKLIEIFNANWYLKNIPARTHPVIGNLVSRGISVFDILSQLGNDILICQEGKKLNNSVKKLRIPDNYQSERDELFFCAQFLKKRMNVVREKDNPENDKNYDLHLKHKDEELAIEIKSTSLSSIQNKIFAAGEYIYQSLLQYFSGKTSYFSIDYSDEFAASSMSKDGIDFLLQCKDQITDLIKHRIQISINHENWGTNKFNGLLNYTIQPPFEKKSSGAFSGFNMNPVLEAYYISDIICKKPRQLPRHCTTLYIITAETVGHFNSIVEPIFHKKLWRDGQFNHVGGILILDKTMDLKREGISPQFAYIPNPNCTKRPSVNNIFKILTQKILGIKVNSS
ncbi:MAG: hypothetical protein HQK83_04530 [Fibrobacteria bacterium]|nr:hypothetical protein [Fibrobacteria bacterium]